MPRACRYFLSGYVWHLTHRCHKKEFLLKIRWHRPARHSWGNTAWVYFLSLVHQCFVLSGIHFITRRGRSLSAH